MTWWLLAALAQTPNPPTGGALTELVPEVPMAGSTWRMAAARPNPDPGTGQWISVFETPQDCQSLLPGEPEASCVPWIVPADRTIHLGFAVLDSNLQPVPMALSPLQFGVAVAADAGPYALQDDQFTLVPHRPVEVGNVVVLVIDQSASMYEGDAPKMEKVVQALMADTTVDAFFPPEGSAQSKVMLLTFRDALTGVDGEPAATPHVLTDRDAYARAVDKLLDPPLGDGWTHLYDAIGQVLDVVLRSQAVTSESRAISAVPTVIVLTDGFNNVSKDDVCASNVEPLGKLLDALAGQRGPSNAASIYTVGFGNHLDPAFRMKKTSPRRPNAAELCGTFANDRIDHGLETNHIDNVSLEYIARAGRGGVLVSQRPEELAQFISNAGARSFAWYELWIRMDPLHQQRFRHRILLQLDVRFPTALATNVSFVPGPYFDAPSGLPGPDGLPRPAGVAQATVDLMLGLGATLGLLAFGIGAYHFRRAVGRMADRVAGGGDGR